MSIKGGLRREFLLFAGVTIVISLLFALVWPWTLLAQVVVLPILCVGLSDYFQGKHTIKRNFPVIGRFRYLLEAVRPEINQYFVESNRDGRPFSREERSVVYQRSKGVLDTLPFGTQSDVYGIGYEWINHSMAPVEVDPGCLRAIIGQSSCKKPYSASLLNISAMSFGSLSKNAIRSLNGGAKDGGFAHNTGEGGISPYHLEHGGDLIWQIGTGYFGCRSADGRFDAGLFQEMSRLDQVKMIEIKLSQGAKPGHGGILPAVKISSEIAAIRGVELGKDVISPPSHSTFSTPIELMEFIQKLRELSGGKPVGIKLCIGKRREFLAVCKAMVQTGLWPDYIAVDGGEGGTGAAPIEFSNRVGSPGVEGLIFAHNSLVGFDLRDKVRVIATGKISSAFAMLKNLALGADLIYSARGMMLALGCIQALRCNANVCPAGIATQDPYLNAGLVVTYKRKRVETYQRETMQALAELIGAMGLKQATDLRPWHVMRRVAPHKVNHYGELYQYIQSGAFLGDKLPTEYERALKASTAESFRHVMDIESRPAIT